MVLCNYAEMTLTAKVVYYGPGLGGKTTNLNHIYGNTDRDSRGEMVSLNTDTERTLFFDLLPIAAGPLGAFKAQVQLYTVPGQVFYNAMRKIVLNGVDGIVFVADSQRSLREVNRQSFENLKTNLTETGSSLEDVPLVFQYNKRDLPDILSVEELNTLLNPEGRHEWVEACASRGLGVFETLEAISKLTFRAVRERFLPEGQEGPEGPGAPELAAAAASEAAPPVAGEAAPVAELPRNRPLRKRPNSGKRPAAAPEARPEQEVLPLLTRDGVSAAEGPPPPPTVAEIKLPAPPEAEPQRLVSPPPASATAPPPAGPQAPEEVPEDWEISFAADTASKGGRSRRREPDLMAEIEKLRIHVGGTPTSPPQPGAGDKKGKGAEPAAALDRLMATALGRPTEDHVREVQERLELPLPKEDLQRLRKLVISIRPEGPSGEPLSPPQQHVVALDDMAAVDRLLLSLKVHLKGR